MSPLLAMRRPGTARWYQSITVLSLLGVMSLLTACGGGNTPATPQLTSIAVGPPDLSVATGLTHQFTATGLYSDGSKQNVSSSVTWSSSNTAVASISNLSASIGLATTVSAGSTTIMAALGGVSGSTTLTVTAATLVSIGVTPTAPSIANGLTQMFTATGVYTDNSTHDLTTSVTWSSSAPSVASVSNGTGSQGSSTALSPGATTITATLGNVSGSTPLTVTAATLVSIGLTPVNPSLALGTQQALTATGTFTDHSTQNLTNAVTWSSSNSAVASVNNSAGSFGLVTALGLGSATMTAALGGVSGSTGVTVTGATLVSIDVTPANASIAAGLKPQFTAMGTYTDNSTQNLTAQVVWSSSNTTVATVSNAVGFDGLGSALTSGSATISASLGNVSGSTALTVTSATLVSLAVTPGSASQMTGSTQQFIATGTYTDNSTQTLTTTVAWTSSDTTVAVISNASGSNGLATALGVGSASISAASGSVLSPSVTMTVTTTGVETVLYSFAGGSDGDHPDAGLIQGSDGNFYGTTKLGGANSAGTVFKITAAGVETVLHSFGSGSDGANPIASLIQGSDGNFYGTTEVGGANNQGTVFKVTPAGVETVLHSFGSGSDGDQPDAGLIQGSDGNFYGTTKLGGANSAGTVFKITAAGAETVLHSFGSGSDGATPIASLIQGSDGNFYGTTIANQGTVFKITAAGVETVLYSFGSGSDGNNPNAALIQGSDGNFYGTTVNGGANNQGTVFKVTPAGIETVLYSFAGGSDAANPARALLQGSDGNFYGTAAGGGAQGTVFKVTPAGIETVLHSFAGGSDGAIPVTVLIQGSDGNFYGTTADGGANGFGTVFKY
jgi:uncharacterized repeat protein (TIGR03803 family)